MTRPNSPVAPVMTATLPDKSIFNICSFITKSLSANGLMSAIDTQADAIDVLSFRRSEKYHGFADVLRRADAPDRHACFNRLRRARLLPVVLGHRRHNHAGG